MLYREEYDIGLLDKIENQFVIRLFRVQANYYRGDYKSYYREYARWLLDGRLFVNSCYVRGMYFEKVYMFSYVDKWRYGPNYFNLNAIFYPNNIKKLLKETPCKYSMIWDLARHQKDTYIDLKKLLNEAPNNPSIELLIKAKLFNLALNADRYNIKGSFEDRFGVPREYYSFMKKYNITSDELDVLKLLKKKNINTIRTLTSNYNINKLQQFANLTSLDNLLKYKNKLGKAFDFDMYLDYLENANLLRFNLKDKKYLFPKDLRQEHDCLVKKVKKIENGEEIEETETYEYNIYRYVYVYDISQTTGKPIPLENHYINGNEMANFYDTLKSFSKFPVYEKELFGDLEGYYSPSKKEIVLKKSLSINDKTAVLLHELTHGLYDDFNYKTDRNLSEVFVESVAYIVADHFGLDTSRCSFNYITQWAKGEAKVIIDLGNKIQKCANQLIKEIEKFEVQDVELAA